MTNGGYLGIIVLLLGLFLFQRCEHKEQMQELRSDFKSLIEFQRTEMTSYFAGKDISVQDIKEVKQNLVSTTKELESIKAQYSDLKRINSIIKSELHTAIKNQIPIIIKEPIQILHDTQGMIHLDTVRKYYIPKGSIANHSELWYDVSLTIGDSLSIDSLNVRNKIDAILAYKKPDKSFKFLRKAEPIVSIQSYNPYSSIGYVNNLVVQDDRKKITKLLTSKVAMASYGVLAGALLVR